MTREHGLQMSEQIQEVIKFQICKLAYYQHTDAFTHKCIIKELSYIYNIYIWSFQKETSQIIAPHQPLQPRRHNYRIHRDIRDTHTRGIRCYVLIGFGQIRAMLWPDRGRCGEPWEVVGWSSPPSSNQGCSCQKISCPELFSLSKLAFLQAI